MAHSASSRVVLFCSLHAVTSSVIYYSTHTWKNVIDLLNTYPKIEINFIVNMGQCLMAKTSLSFKLQGIYVNHITDVTNHRSFLIPISLFTASKMAPKYKMTSKSCIYSTYIKRTFALKCLSPLWGF